jgi:hypothetical protein
LAGAPLPLPGRHTAGGHWWWRLLRLLAHNCHASLWLRLLRRRLLLDHHARLLLLQHHTLLLLLGGHHLLALLHDLGPDLSLALLLQLLYEE